MESTNPTEGPVASTEQRMKAIVQDRYGSPEVLRLADVASPNPSDGEVCVEVRASSLNMYDWHMITGTPYMARTQAGWRKPKNRIPGADVAGVVAAVGANVKGLAPGDPVFGDIGSGAWAERVCIDPLRLAAMPPNVTFEQAAAAPLAGLTALQGLRDVAAVESGQRVLINGASGGVGTFAVQIAKALGAEVTAVCSTSKVDMVQSIGADQVIDYTRHDFVESERGYDVLFDNVGYRPWSETRRVLTPRGINVTITGPKHRWLGPFRLLVYRKVASLFTSQTMTWFTARANQSDLEHLADLLASGGVTPVIEGTYDLEKTPDALRHLGEGHALGKVVITI